MKVKTSSPITGLAGHTKGSYLVSYERNGQIVARAWTKTPNPKAPDQLRARAFQAAAARHWGSITAADRAAWETHARKNYRRENLSGYLLFRRIQYLRQAMGLGLAAHPPTLPPPPAPRAIIQEPATDPAEFRFRIGHTISAVAGYTVRFDLTPAMPSPGRTPRQNEFRMIRHVAPESFLPLQPTGQLYTIPNARFRITPGQRYALKATILTPEAVPGRTRIEDFIRI